MRKVQSLEELELGYGGRNRPRELVGSESQGLEINERRNGRRDWAIEKVISEVKSSELGELGNEWSEFTRVTRRVKSDLDDSGRVRATSDSTSEVGPARRGTWVSGGEVPGG